MRVRSSIAAVVLGLAALAPIQATDHATATSAVNAPARAATVTVTGSIERVAVHHPEHAHFRYALRGETKTWWLVDVPDPAPPPGSVVEVVGAPVDGETLSVEQLQVVAAGPADTITAVSGSTKVLVLRAYWTARPPSAPTTATTRQRVITDSQAWFGQVSYGRYTVTGTVTPWLRIPTPSSCYGGSYTSMDGALAAARRAGYNLSAYGRFVLYLPCDGGGILGLGSLPGAYVWLFGTLGKQVVMHEQGHNLGLRHASSRQCRSSAWPTVTWSSNCVVSEYGDEIDTMGNRRAGHFGSYYKYRLGWLPNYTTVTSTRTVTLAPYETTGAGFKAIRLRSGSSTFWLEFRTRTGFDAAMPAGTAGVQIRYQAPNEYAHLLDAWPGSKAGFYDYADVHLPAGSSWTTPQGVRVKVLSQSASAAKVAITFGAGAPRAPNAPASLSIQARVSAARIAWDRPNDNGSIIRRYVLTRLDNGAKRTLVAPGGNPTSFLWSGLSPDHTYRFAVRAVNQVGQSAAVTTRSVRPIDDRPSIAITSPAAGATVRGIVRVSVSVARNTRTNSPIDRVELTVDGTMIASYDFSSPWGPFDLDVHHLADGPRTIRARVYDARGQSRVATRSVMVNNPVLASAITSPAHGATVTGPINVGYSLTPSRSNWPWQSVELRVDGTPTETVQPGEALHFDPRYAGGPGSYSLRVRATDQWGQIATSPAITVTVPTPTVAITSPAPGATVTTPVNVGYSLSPAGWQWSWVELVVDGDTWNGAAPGDPLQLDPVAIGPGSHTIRVRAMDVDWTAYTSPARTITVPTPTVAITSPAAGATLSGPFSVAYTLSPASWAWYDVYLYIDGSFVTSAAPGTALQYDTTWVGSGSHVLQVRAVDQQFHEFASASRTVNFADP